MRRRPCRCRRCRSGLRCVPAGGPRDRAAAAAAAPHAGDPAAAPAERDPATGEPPVQAWPNIPARLPADADSPVSADPEPARRRRSPMAVPAAPDSPWAQPPHRPVPPPPDVDIQALGTRGRATPPPARARSPQPAPDQPVKTERADYYPTVTPRQNGDGPNGGGTVYRPEPRQGEPPPPPGPHHPAARTPRSTQPSGPRRSPAAPVTGQARRPGQRRSPAPRAQSGPSRPDQPQPGPADAARPVSAVGRSARDAAASAREPAAADRTEQPGPPPSRPEPPVDPYQQVPWVSDGTPTAEEFARRRLAKPGRAGRHHGRPRDPAEGHDGPGPAGARQVTSRSTSRTSRWSAATSAGCAR